MDSWSFRRSFYRVITSINQHTKDEIRKRIWTSDLNLPPSQPQKNKIHSDHNLQKTLNVNGGHWYGLTVLQ